MHAGRRYTFKEFIIWTRREIYKLVILATIPTLLYVLAGWSWLAMPWVPIALVGTAAAFIVGFRNTQTYNRTWEARQIYGAIVNVSRAWGIMVKDCISKEENSDVHKEMMYRHIAWLHALRYQLRDPRLWENIKNNESDLEYSKHYRVEEWDSRLEDALAPVLSAQDLAYVLSKKNRATHLVSLQSKRLKELNQDGAIEPLSYIEMENLLVTMYDQQGKCERIKNFPYPRQFATISQMFVHFFLFLIPFGALGEFHKLVPAFGDWMIWLSIPCSVTISFVFMAMERTGEVTENPFEGGPNDVPITSMTRTIEIDLREMLDETELPPTLTPVNNILM